jgi:hypothetical protein
MKVFLYYLLYLFYYRKGNTDSAEKYFKIARSLSDEKLKKITEMEEETKNIDYSIFDIPLRKIGEFSYNIFIKDFFNMLFESHLMWFFKLNLKTVFLDDDVYFIYISSRPSGKIDFIPLGNFYDIKGNILKAKYRQLSHQSYTVEVEENEEIKGMPVIFSGTQNNLLKKNSDTYIIEYSETILVPRVSKRVFTLSPKYRVKNIESSHPYTIQNANGYTVIIIKINTVITYKKVDINVKIDSEKTEN